jgi:hypothetical protein
MLSTLFSLVCPDCTHPMVVDGAGRAACPGCQQAYLVRVGHLIVDPSPPTAARTDTADERVR